MTEDIVSLVRNVGKDIFQISVSHPKVTEIVKEDIKDIANSSQSVNFCKKEIYAFKHDTHVFDDEDSKALKTRVKNLETENKSLKAKVIHLEHITKTI